MATNLATLANVEDIQVDCIQFVIERFVVIFMDSNE